MAGSAAAQSAAPPVARFDYVTYSGTPDAETMAVKPGDFANPVLPGFQPDPSIVRVGDDYYLVNSTFSWFPGLPVYHSKDLVHWRQIGNAIDRPGQLTIGKLGVTRGLFAPAISHHAGRFYIVNTCIECGGNFIITADNPAGPWSDPHWLDFGGIDPSLFVDDDGRAWIAYNDAPPGPPGYDGHRALWLQRIDLTTMKMAAGRVLLVDKGVHAADKPVWAEGPHIYKVGRHYYLTAAEGGTADRHSQTIYRADKVDGPYVAGSNNPILTQRDLPEGRAWPVQATGHADFVQIPDGSWWAVFLATRPYAGQQTNLGRETFLLPVNWKDGWPLILQPTAAITPTSKRPALPAFAGDDFTRWRDEFEQPRLARDWMMLRTPQGRDWWNLSDRRGMLQLTARPVAAGSLDQPSFVGKRLRHHDAVIETRVEFAPLATGDRAGLLALTDENHFLFFGRERLADGEAIVLRRRTAAGEAAEGIVAKQSMLGDKAPMAIDLQMRINRDKADLSWRPAGTGAWQSLAKGVDASILATVGAGLFTGAVIGPHAARAERAF
ncbi:glycoside hydrolase family 43 protein [Sphingomonas sp. LT1P40]|uniref:glycoside hydrolase family 43 protein n=1 Tax=Alteristakelama amylovorans TaxID=3096166 RepID=UPI002FC6AC32